MPRRAIVKYGAAVLHTPAAAVAEIDASVRTLVDDMVATMYAAPGIGLAAPQVGVALRVIVIDLSVGAEPDRLIKLVNPVFDEQEGEQCLEEGCLSIPGFGGSPLRPARVVVSGIDPDRQDAQLRRHGLLARAFCHEIDHIDGLVFVDRLTPFKRDLMKRKLRKKGRAGRLGGGAEGVRIVFFGSGAFAIPSLRRFSRRGHELPLVVTQPDRERGRGRELAPPPVKVARGALPARIPTAPGRAPESLEALRRRHPTSRWWSRTARSCRRRSSRSPPLGTINVHASLLPRYRGAAPIQWAIADGEARRASLR